jgi:hypothetical protein
MNPTAGGEIMSELFQRLVMRETNMALLLLGRIPHPETGELLRDLASAKDYVDHLEMLEHKTRGNLGDAEEALLRKSIAAARTDLSAELEADDVKLSDDPPASP